MCTSALSTSGRFPSSSHKIPRSTSATRAILVLSSIILPLQTFFSRVLLLRQLPFSSENLPPERPTITIAIKTQVFVFRYESVNSTRKFTIVAEIVSLLKKIYKRDAPFRAVFKVKTLAVLFSAYPREMKHIPRNLNLPPFCRCLFLWKWCNPFPRARARLKHAHSFDRCGARDRDSWCWPKGARPLGTRMRSANTTRSMRCNTAVQDRGTGRRLRWPNTVLARALADAIQRAHKDCKNKHAVDTAIILFAQCPLYLCYFSS